MREKRSEGFTVSRRTFLGLSAGAAAAATAAYVIKWPHFDLGGAAEATEGVITEEWVPTSCLNCPTRCAVKVRVVNGKAVRIIGSTESDYSGGKTCPRSHVGLQVLYNPERFTRGPLIRKAGSAKGGVVDLERDFESPPAHLLWPEAISQVAARLKKTAPEKVLIIEGLSSTSNSDLICQFARTCSIVNLFPEDALETGADRLGKKMADGRLNSGYDLENSNYILAFGASILESERPLARNLRMWGKIRRERPNQAKVVVIDPRYSVTAAKADEWIPVNPGAEGALAMAMAHVIVDEGLYDADFIENWTSGFDQYRALLLSDFSPEALADMTGVDASVVRRLAREFAASKPAIAWSGIGATRWPHGGQASHAIFCLNALVGSIDAPGGVLYQESPPYQDMPPATGAEPGISFREAANLVLNGGVDVIIGVNSNLIMAVPQKADWDEALKREDLYYVHIGPAVNEMVAYADVVLPSATYLEEWAYETALPGSGYAEARIKQPVVGPLHSSRQVGWILFDLVKEIHGETPASFDITSGDAQTFAEEFVKYRTEPLIDWSEFKKKGVWVGQAYEYAKDNPAKYNEIFQTGSGKFEFRSDDLPDVLTVQFSGDASRYPLKLVTYSPVLDVKDGNQNYPWAQEIFLVMHGYGWDILVEINAETARDLGISDRDMVWVESEVGRIKARARVFEGMVPGVVAMAVGQGHYACGKWADDIGVNPNEIIALDYDSLSGQAAFHATRVKVYKA